MILVDTNYVFLYNKKENKNCSDIDTKSEREQFLLPKRLQVVYLVKVTATAKIQINIKEVITNE